MCKYTDYSCVPMVVLHNIHLHYAPCITSHSDVLNGDPRLKRYNTIHHLITVLLVNHSNLLWMLTLTGVC